MGKVKIELAFQRGSKKLVTWYKPDAKSAWEDIVRAAEWQATLCKVTGGPQTQSTEVRPVLAHKLYYLGATQTITEMP